MENRIKKGSAEFQLALSDLEQIKQFRREVFPTGTTAKGIAILGRSNVGKSSIINALFGKNTARVSKTPGRTKEIIIFNFKTDKSSETTQTGPTFYLFDLPGYGHASVSKQMHEQWQRSIDLFLRTYSSHLLFILLQDARHPNQESDQHLIKYLRPLNIQSILVLNKIDKLKTQKEKSELKKGIPEISKKFKSCRQIYFVSAETGEGLLQLEESILNFIQGK